MTTGDQTLRVSLITPVRNGARTIGDCLTAALRLDYPPDRLDVLVVDNGSSDRTLEIVSRFPVRCIRESRRGAVHARNRGIGETDGEILAFVDADCILTKEWLSELVRPFAEASVCATTGELVAFPPATPAERYMARRKPRWQQWAASGPTPWFLIGNMAIRRTVFDRIGLLDPAFAIVGCEDIDLSCRFFAAGLVLRHCPRAVAFHRHRSTMRSLFWQQLRIGRGQSLVQAKYGSAPWGLRQEMDAWRDLSAAAWRAVSCRWRSAAGVSRGPDSRDDAYYDLIRKLAQRIGFAHGMLSLAVAGIVAAGRDTEWP